MNDVKYPLIGPQDAKVQFKKFDLTPQPLKMGENANLAALMIVTEPIRDGFSDLTIYRVFTVFGLEVPIPLPCIDGYGSCFTQLEFTLQDPDIGLGCGLVRDGNNTCGLPIEKGIIGTDSHKFPVPPLNGFFSLLATVSN